MNHIRVALKVICLGLVGVWLVWGCCETDKTILNVGPGALSGILCPDGITDAALGCGLAPNPVPTNHLDVFVNSPNVYTSLDIVRLIIGIPLGSGEPTPAASSLPAIDQITVYNPYYPPGSLDPSPSVWTADRYATYCGSLTSGETNAYAECGIFAVSGSNSFANWQGAAQDLGLNPVKFALYYYNLASAENTVGYGLYDIALTGNLPVGTMEIAYGCATGYCDNYCYVTPFQNAGQVVPEPSSLLLVAGAGLVALLARRRRKA